MRLTPTHRTMGVAMVLVMTCVLLTQVGFGAPVNYAVGSAPRDVATGDFNGDGHLDLVAANSGTNTITVLFGNGDGTFGASFDLGVGNGAPGMRRRLRSDQAPDIAVAIRGDNTVSVILGQGHGRFRAAVDYAVGDGPYQLDPRSSTATSQDDLAVSKR